jgi:hypothetical protein
MNVNSRTFHLSFLFVFFVPLISIAFAGEGLNGSVSDNEKVIPQLIEKLVSPRPTETVTKNILGVSVSRKYPQSARLEAEKRVHETWDRIIAEGISAFPYLISYYDDNRFSIEPRYANKTSVSMDYTVGLVCRDMLQSQIEPFGNDAIRHSKDRPSYTVNFLYIKKDALVWLKTNGEKTLYDIQLEALKWTIAEEKKLNTPESVKDVYYLTDVLKKLENSQKPLPPNPFFSERTVFEQITYR